MTFLRMYIQPLFIFFPQTYIKITSGMVKAAVLFLTLVSI